MRLDGPIDLAATLLGGQAFRWRREGDAFVGAVNARLVVATQDGAGADARAWPTMTRAALSTYLGLDAAQDAARARLALDDVLAPALAAHAGLRILRQDAWEATVAFVTSANNNVPRITGILHALADRYGAPLDAGVRQARAFPEPERLARASERDLRACGLGYRAPFVRETARAVARGDVDLRALRGASLEEAREALLALPGVGPKVADCIALFGLAQGGAFPVDRWVLRAVSEAFFAGAPVTPRECEAFARARWGDDAGLAQQFLFHAVRLRARAPGTRALAA